MRNGSLETQSVARAVAAVPGASTVLRRYGIDSTNRLPLWEAANAASVTSDEVLAVIEARMRRQAQRAQVHAYEEEFAF